MRYCKRCIIPDTRPNISFNTEGICNGCSSFGERAAIDWAKRERTFREVVKSAKAKSRGYDCLIPVSGGKDSTWQVVKCLEYGLRPLTVTWRPPSRTAIGQKNLDNLVSLGVDHIDYQINPNTEKKFLLAAMKRYGAAAVPMHMAMFNIPLTVASRFNIPLVVWGENSAFEYGGTDDERHGFMMDDNWLKKFGVTHGTTAKDWVSKDLTEQELAAYFGPSPAELAARDIHAIFLGYYFPWDPETSLRVAEQHGFARRKEGPKLGYYDYADIDDNFISIHHYVKWYKFGFTRSYDNLSLEIRNGRMTRREALAWLKKRGDETPNEDIDTFCRFTGMSRQGFFDLIEPFRNLDLWKKAKDKWYIPDFLIPDWKWSEYKTTKRLKTNREKELV